MDEHTQRCIVIFEALAADHEATGRSYSGGNYSGGNNVVDPASIYYHAASREFAVAKAYRTCIEMLKDPNYFDSDRHLNP